MKIYRKLAAVALGTALILGASAASCGSSADTGVEVEDCDAEDYRNKEDDCGFTDSDRRKTPTVKKTPTVRKTRR